MTVGELPIHMCLILRPDLKIGIIMINFDPKHDKFNT